MKHKPVRFRGKFRKVFCNCNDSWTRVVELNQERGLKLLLGESVVTTSVVPQSCSECGLHPWVYISKADEPASQE